MASPRTSRRPTSRRVKSSRVRSRPPTSPALTPPTPSRSPTHQASWSRCRTTGRPSAPQTSRIASRSPAAFTGTSAAMIIIPTARRQSPQKLDDGENLRRARIGILGKFFGDWNYALVYDFGGSSDGFGGTATTGRPRAPPAPRSASCRAARSPGSRMPISATPASSRSAARWRSRAASWTCSTRWMKPQVRTTSCSWNAHRRASSRRTSRPAISAPPPARAGTMTASGSAPMRPDRPPARSTPPRASIRTAPPSNSARSPASPARSSAATTTRCISAARPSG